MQSLLNQHARRAFNGNGRFEFCLHFSLCFSLSRQNDSRAVYGETRAAYIAVYGKHGVKSTHIITRISLENLGPYAVIDRYINQCLTQFAA